MTFHLHSDPGHAWLAVPVTFIYELGIERSISDFSYFDPETQTGYLEEDCDLYLFDQVLKDRGIGWDYINHHTDDDSFVRNLPSWKSGLE